MRRPQTMERVTSTDSRAFFYNRSLPNPGSLQANIVINLFDYEKRSLSKTGAIQLFLWIIGIFNVLPIPALDGGQSCACIFEMATKKKIPAKVYQTVTTIFFVALLALMAVITVKDIIGLF